MVQHGFLFDQSRCVNCHTCSVACREWNDIEPGPVKWRRIFRWEEGAFPQTRLHVLSLSCLHCENPVCLDACIHGVIYKEEKYGAVLIDREKCGQIRETSDCRKCWEACPYGVPQFDHEGTGGAASMCTMCIDRLDQGMYPICTEACRMRALDFGTLEDLERKYGQLRDLQGLPVSSLTSPSVVFKPHARHKEIVTYAADRARELLAERGNLPPLYNSPMDVTKTIGLVTTTAPLLKTKTVEEALYWTKADEG